VELSAATAEDERAGLIAALYAPQANGAPPLVLHGHLPPARRTGAPEWELKTRRRMIRLLNSHYAASPAEVSVLREAGIPLKAREGGGFHIDPTVPRQSAHRRAEASARSAEQIGRLYGLVPGSIAQVPWGVLPMVLRKGAPEEEKRVRRRMHRLLESQYAVSPAEEFELRRAGIPLKTREGGGFHIDPAVQRESDMLEAEASTRSAEQIRRLYGLVPGATAQVAWGVLPTLRREGASHEENSVRQRLHHLCGPRYSTTPAEVSALQEAGLALKVREGGGFSIDPSVARQGDLSASRGPRRSTARPAQPAAAPAGGNGVRHAADYQASGLSYPWRDGQPSAGTGPILSGTRHTSSTPGRVRTVSTRPWAVTTWP
jgi:hypothetical protein